MRGDIKAPKGKDTRDFVRKLTLEAAPDNEVDQMKLALIAYAVFPLGPRLRDPMFDEWINKRIGEYCKQNKVRIERSETKSPNGSDAES
jgi:hypothetical protein